MRIRNGWTLAAVQILLLLGMVAKYAYERETLPQVWVRTGPVDPDTPLRGRYVTLFAEVEYKELQANSYLDRFQLRIDNGRLIAESNPSGYHRIVRFGEDKRWFLSEPLAYFIPEHIPDPSRLGPDEELWVLVSVPPSGAIRPVAIEKRKRR
jgi:hypothetical protein